MKLGPEDFLRQFIPELRPAVKAGMHYSLNLANAEISELRARCERQRAEGAGDA